MSIRKITPEDRRRVLLARLKCGETLVSEAQLEALPLWLELFKLLVPYIREFKRKGINYEL